LLGFVALVLVASILLMLPFWLLFGRPASLDSHRAMALMALAECVAYLGAAWVMVRFAEDRPFSSLGFDLSRLATDGLTGLRLGAAGLALALGGAALLGAVSLKPAGEPGASAIAWVAALVLLKAASEEFLVHGYIFQVLERVHPGLALTVTSTLFTLLHWSQYRDDWLAAANLFLAGTWLGLMYRRSRNLWMPVACHFAWNFLLGPLLGLTVSGTNRLNLEWTLVRLEGPAWLVGGQFGLEGGAVTTLALTALVAALLARRPRARNSAEPPAT
jgi:membrane protease YdiL (CAAX protease family)